MKKTTMTANFRGNIRSALASLGWSQRRLARESGVHYVSICRILSGNQTPTVEVCERMARALRLSPRKIFLESSGSGVDARKRGC